MTPSIWNAAAMAADGAPGLHEAAAVRNLTALVERMRIGQERALEEAGWLIFEVKWADVGDPARLDALVYDAFLLGLAHMRRVG